jgi:Pyruvate/2-oxoglutarate dehydrogenase complex, dehydrogenase (E1) component, eukaryotic type, alpha subunit
VELWRSLDPINRLGKRLIALGLTSQEELREIGEKAREEVREAIEYAERSPLPDPSEALRGVFK